MIEACRPSSLVAIIVGTGLLAGCTSRSERSNVGTRSIIASNWDTVWTVSGESEHAILQPVTLAADREHIFIVDWSEQRLVALRHADGVEAWSVGRKGSGPGEFQELAFVSMTPGGDVAVVDQLARRMTTYGSDGSARSDVSLLPLGGAPESFCAQANGGFLFALFATDSLVELLPSGARGRSVGKPSPVSDPKGLLNQVLLAGDATGTSCAAVLYVGAGFSSLSKLDSTRSFSYVEAMEVPQWLLSTSGADSLSSEAVSARHAVVRNDTLWVLFEGKTDWRRRLLDAYDLRTGSYLSTLLLPTRANKFALSGDLIVLQAPQKDGSVAFVAIRPAGSPKHKSSG